MKSLKDFNVQRFFMFSCLLLLVSVIAIFLFSGTIIVADVPYAVRVIIGSFWLTGEIVLLIITLAETYYKNF